MKAFISAIMFLTRIPMPIVQISNEDWRKSSSHFPIVGLIIGLLLYLISALSQHILPTLLVAFITLLFWVWITGGLHLDGWMDLADGLGSSRSREEMLVIMKDSRVGAMGVIAAMLLLLGKLILLYELLQAENSLLFIMAPLYARTMLIIAIRFWSYRQEGGMGAGLHSAITPPIIYFHLTWIMGLTYFMFGMKGVFLFAATLVTSILFVKQIYKKLGMLTGDCYGAIVEWTEAVTLFLSIIIWRLIG